MTKTIRVWGTGYLMVLTADDPGPGGAHHKYDILTDAGDKIGDVSFQKGAILEAGINGVTHEALLGIVAHRLMSFQNGDFSCRENAMAITKIQEALHWLDHRTALRTTRGVEGKHEK